MATYLFSWDPNKWDWRNIKEQSDSVANGSPVSRPWNCGDARRIFVGDRVYLIRQSKEPRGIFATAEVTRGSYEATNIDVQDAVHGKNTLVVDIQFEMLVNAAKKVGISRTDLGKGALSKFRWDIKKSGEKIPDNIAEALEKEWESKVGLTSAKAKALEEEQARQEEEERKRKEEERKAKEEAEQKAKEEKERKAKEAAERKAQEEERKREEKERKAKEAAERKAQEEERKREEKERKAKEAAERKAQEEERKREEEERKAKEAAEQKAKEEEERKREEEERKAKEAAVRKAKEDEERKQQDEELQKAKQEARKLQEEKDRKQRELKEAQLSARKEAEEIKRLEVEKARLEKERLDQLHQIKEREEKERLAREKAAQEKEAVLAAVEKTPKASLEEIHRSIVEDYFTMLKADVKGDLYSRADHRNRLQKELGLEDDDVIDENGRKISAVLSEIGLPVLDGYLPDGDVSAELETTVHVYIEGAPEIIESLWVDKDPGKVSVPVELDDSRAFWVATPSRSTFRPDPDNSWVPGIPLEIDFREREQRNNALQVAGERFVLAFERARLRESGRKDLIEQLGWVTQTHGYDLGYHIRSFEEDGRDRLIAVKTTNYSSRFPFSVSRTELACARANSKSFFIYRVFGFSRGAKLFIMEGGITDESDLLPISFRVNT